MCADEEMKAIVTVAINIPETIAISEPFFIKYAEKVKADYIKVSDRKINNPNVLTVEKYQLKDILKRYQRVILLDADMIIRHDTPDLFNLVPIDHVGGVYDNPTNVEDYTYRIAEIKNIMHNLGKIRWTKKYLNTGMLVLSYMHVHAYDLSRWVRTTKNRIFTEQNSVNWNIAKNGYKIFKLDRSFNWICFSRDEAEFMSSGKMPYILHFAGLGHRIELMRKYANLFKV